MRKIAICDDQPEVVQFIKKACQKFYSVNKGVSIFCFASGEEVLLSDEHFDVLFMDIELENMNGIETCYELRKTDHDALLVMISANEKYKMDAYPLHVFNFLDKPFAEKDIINLLKEIEVYCDRKKEHIFIPIKLKEGYINVDVLDIIYFESNNRKIKLVTKQDTYEFYSKMGEQIKKMQEYGFGIPHSSYIVNFKYIKSMKNKEVILTTGHCIPMTKYKAKEFKDAYTTFLKNQLRK